MTELINNTGYFIIWFFFPFVPAFILFKFLPNRAIVTGPLKGLNLNFGGSFAAYFILFLVAAAPIIRLIRIQNENFEVWTISGKIIGQNNMPIDPNAHLGAVFTPPVEVDSTGFLITIVGEQQNSDLVAFANIRIDGAPYYHSNLLPKLNYRRTKLNMDTVSWNIDYETRTAELKKPVVLRRK